MDNLNEIICFSNFFYHSAVCFSNTQGIFTTLDHMLGYGEKCEIPIIFIFSEYTSTELELNNKIIKSKLCLS